MGTRFDHAGRREGVLRISRFADGAVGWAGGRGVYGWARDRGQARSQRLASGPLYGDQWRAGDHGLRSGRASGKTGRGPHEGQTRAGPDAAGRYRAEAFDYRRRSEEGAGGAPALSAVAEGKSDYAGRSAEPQARSADRPRNHSNAAAR